MARKPIELELAGMLTPRERVWAAVRKLRTFTLLELQDHALPLVPFATVEFYIRGLIKAGYVAPVAAQTRSKQQFEEVQYKLLKDSFEAPRVTRDGAKVTQGASTLAMWRAMIALKEFDWHEVQCAASLPGMVIRPQTASSYVQALARAGYFRTVRPSKPGTAARYRLIKHTGAHAPAITRRKTVFDRNTGEFVWQETAQEVVDGLE